MQGGKRIGIYPAGGVAWFDPANNVGTFRTVYQLTPQLSDQAAEYAYMSLGLSPMTPIGAGVVVKRGFNHTAQAPMTALQTPRAAGIPTTAGQFEMTPLSREGIYA